AAGHDLDHSAGRVAGRCPLGVNRILDRDRSAGFDPDLAAAGAAARSAGFETVRARFRNPDVAVSDDADASAAVLTVDANLSVECEIPGELDVDGSWFPFGSLDRRDGSGLH